MERNRLQLECPEVRRKARRLRPETAELAAGHAAQASKAVGHHAETLQVEQLLGGGLVLPARRAEDGPLAREKVQRNNEAPQELARGRAEPPAAEAAPRKGRARGKSRRNRHGPDRPRRRSVASRARKRRGRVANQGAEGAAARCRCCKKGEPDANAVDSPAAAGAENGPGTNASAGGGTPRGEVQVLLQGAGPAAAFGRGRRRAN